MGQPAYRARQLLHGLYREQYASLGEFTTLPATFCSQIQDEGYELAPAVEVRRVMSDDGATTKLLLRMADGILIETVLMQYAASGGRSRRSTVCVSTQAGCAMGCVFCATGQMGFERNLRAEEVLAQVLAVQHLLAQRGEHVTNIVFMGMGEPLANYAETIRAVRLLTDVRAFGLGQRHITISTVGLVHAIDRLAAEQRQVGLAISLHAPNDELRQRLVPTAGPTSVADLMAAAKRYFHATGRRVTFEYALLDGVNDTPEVAAELARLLRGSGSHVNLIPVNPTAGGFGRPSRTRTLTFERVLLDAGINCTVRVEKGTEISAACGQLRTDAANGLAADLIPLASVPVRGRRQSPAAPAQSQSR
jgi:23S rRNA (adenine2503-C2)-methyltransferase